MFNKRITEIVKQFLCAYIVEGSIGLDLTAGNGYDTCFLAEKVGISGHVYAFDIQALALNNTKNRLLEQGFGDRVTLTLDSHENVKKHISLQVHVIMMNLGYLPSGDKTVITTPKTTIDAIKNSLDLLAVNGVMSIVSYYGHEGGQSEKEALESFLKGLDPDTFEIMSLFYPNRGKSAPILHFMRKVKPC